MYALPILVLCPPLKIPNDLSLFQPRPHFKILLTLLFHLLQFNKALEGEYCKVHDATKAGQGNLMYARTFWKVRTCAQRPPQPIRDQYLCRGH
ncbi:hypothetical protein ACTXT7_004127 [Hymenolepis weldensis]